MVNKYHIYCSFFLSFCLVGSCSDTVLKNVIFHVHHPSILTFSKETTISWMMMEMYLFFKVVESVEIQSYGNSVV